MLTLYVKTGCPYCAMVIHKLEELGLEYEEKNVADPGIAEELIARGGKRQMPYLVDSEAGVEMYESADICDHLEAQYGAK
jgi:glutaredoxin 3